MRIKNGEQEGENEEDASEPASEFREDVRRLRAEQILGHAAAKCCAKPFAFRALHQDDEDHEERIDHVKCEQDVDENVHRDREYGEGAWFVNAIVRRRGRGLAEIRKGMGDLNLKARKPERLNEENRKAGKEQRYFRPFSGFVAFKLILLLRA